MDSYNCPHLGVEDMAKIFLDVGKDSDLFFPQRHRHRCVRMPCARSD